MVTSTLDEQRLHRLIDVGRSLVSDLDLESLLHTLLEAARDLTGARYAALGVLDEDHDQLERFLAVGIGERERRLIGDPPCGRGVIGLLIDDPKPIRLKEVSAHEASSGFPPGHPPMSTFLGVPIQVRGEAYGTLCLTEKQGREFDQADEDAIVILADWAAIAVENARLYEDVASRRFQLERAVRGLEATTTIARALDGETELERVLELIVKRGRVLIDATWMAILLHDGSELEVVAAAGNPGRDLHGVRIPTAGSISGEVLSSKRTERISDVAAAVDGRTTQIVANARTALFVPLVFRGTALGTLIAADKSVGGPEFTAEDEHLVMSFAAAAAIAVHTAQSVAAARLRESIEASEQERARWARELHDETLQGLGGLQVLLSSALRRGPGETLEHAVGEAITQIGLEITNLRTLIAELRPAALDEIGLQPALESLVKRVAANEDFEISTEIAIDRTDAKRLVPELEGAIYRVVQESLTNISKHADARTVKIEISEAGARISVRITDDGSGFDVHASTGGFGLRGIRERVALVGGELRIDSAPDGGTTIHATAPVQEAA